MSKIRLPELKVAGRPSNLAIELSDQVLERWNPGIRAAREDEDSVISIYDPIGFDWTGEGVTAKRIAAALKKIDGDVVVNINSPGGDVFEGIAIYSLLREHEGEVTVRVLGSAFSAASVIAMAGDTIQIARPGFLMIHNVWMLAMGNRNDLRKAADVLEPMDRALADLYAARTGLAREDIAKMMDDETWLGGSDAVERGFADELLPADQVEETEDEAQPAAAARRRVEALLQKAGAPRSERRALLRQLAGTPRAADDTMPGAGVEASVQWLTELAAEQRAQTLFS